MANNRKTLGATVEKFVLKSQAALLGVFQQSCQDLFELAQTPVAKGGNMPVVTGFLRSSFSATINTPSVAPMYRGSVKDVTYSFENTAVVLVISNAKLGDKIYGLFAANYARPREYGTARMPGAFFVRNSAQQWPQIVAKNVTKLSRMQ